MNSIQINYIKLKMSSISDIYHIKNIEEFAIELTQIIKIIIAVGATQEEINQRMDYHCNKWIEKQEELCN